MLQKRLRDIDCGYGGNYQLVERSKCYPDPNDLSVNDALKSRRRTVQQLERRVSEMRAE